jgi:hypothetical protein
VAKLLPRLLRFFASRPFRGHRRQQVGGSNQLSPVILPISAPLLSAEEAQDKICELLELLRTRSLEVRQQKAVAGNLRNWLDVAERKAQLAFAELELSQLAVARLKASQKIRRRVIHRLAAELREHRHALDQFKNGVLESVECWRDELTLEPMGDVPPLWIGAATRAGCTIRDRDNHTAAVAIISQNRRLLARIIERLVPTKSAVSNSHLDGVGK